MSVPLPDTESQRLAALYGHQILDTPPEPVFDRVTALAAQLCKAPIALMSLVDRDRQWFKARCGSDLVQVPRAHGLCSHAILGSHVMVVPDVAGEERFRDNPLVLASPGIRSYAGAPLIVDGGFRLGTLCVLHHEVTHLGDDQVVYLASLAAMLADALEVRRRLRAAEAEQEDFNARVAEFEFTRSLLEEQAAQLVELAEDREELYRSNIRNRRFIESLLDTVPIPIFARDETEAITHANPAYAAFFGLDLQDIRGRRVSDILSPEHADQVREENRRLLLEPSGRLVYEKRVTVCDSARDLILHKAIIRGDDGSSQGIVGAIVDVTEQKALQTALEQLAATDPLTGAANRRAFMDKMHSEAQRSQRSGRPLSIVMIDIDKFKAVNDTYGHQTGDEVLKRVSAVCRQTIRESVDMLARFGGEEFVVVAPDTDLDGAAALAERLRRGLEAQQVVCEGGPIRFTASFGVASVGPAGTEQDIDEALRRADECLYLSKKNGRNRVTVAGAARMMPAA